MTELVAAKRSADDRYKTERAEAKAAKQRKFVAEEALDIANEIALTIERQAHESIARIVTRCLEAVFDDPYEFVIDFQRKRGRTAAVLRFRRGGYDIDPTKQAGGGPVDVAAFALRLAALVLARPPGRRCLILDEPFKHVSIGYRERIRELVLALAEEFQIQFIFTTHSEELKIGKVIHIKGPPPSSDVPRTIIVDTVTKKAYRV